ncbi:hypothetical protein [Aeromonas schubertii]|uniref:hypothetical protein n=1 Tax=Aeromonas schubertii TaxID=652 RepID=UPI001D04BF46|nr:hypothetical protein [Aeromonas schubertii]
MSDGELTALLVALALIAMAQQRALWQQLLAPPSISACCWVPPWPCSRSGCCAPASIRGSPFTFSASPP